MFNILLAASTSAGIETSGASLIFTIIGLIITVGIGIIIKIGIPVAIIILIYFLIKKLIDYYKEK